MKKILSMLLVFAMMFGLLALSLIHIYRLCGI